MIKIINGWTKEKVIECITKHVHGLAGEDGACFYETSQGNRCAIGAFLDHKIHQKEVFDYFGPIDHMLSKYPEIAKTLPFEEATLAKLQLIHDNWDGDEDETYNKENYNAVEDALIGWVEENVE